MLFARLLEKYVRDGNIRIVDSRGKSHIIGSDKAPACTVRIHSLYTDFKLCLNPGLQVPEAYMNGELTIENGTLYDFIEICVRNFRNLERSALFRFTQYFNIARLGQFNPMSRARKNVAHHYDLSNDLYGLFLDSDSQYSCAYFADGDNDLENAQRAKKRHLASKLLLKPGLKTLDIGCGWGGLALYLGQLEKLDVTGITLSNEQLVVAQQRAKDANPPATVDFRLQDYRKEKAVYDRIVSVGMFEHVGKPHYREFFKKISGLLSDDGVMVLHSIGRFDRPSPINPFIRKYIFPGADLPSLSEVTAAIEPFGLYVTDVEILRLHYAKTLRIWRERFVENWEPAAKIFDERFCRMWEVYLLVCEMGFRYQNLMVFQLQLTKRLDAVPLTRDYMVDWERRQTEVEAGKQQHAA